MNVLELTKKLFTYLCHLLIAFANSLDPDQAQRFVGYLSNWLTDCNQICMGIGFDHLDPIFKVTVAGFNCQFHTMKW